MYSKTELLAAMEELLNGKHTIQNCEKLASVIAVYNHLYSEPIDKGYSFDNNVNVVGNYGESEFLQLISGQSMEDVMPIIDELVETVQVLNPRLYASFIRKLDKK